MATQTTEKISEKPPKRLPETATIAKWVLAISGAGIVAISATAILGTIGSGAQARLEVSRSVFNALLPLLGTWVGTVLAYYFSKENFDAASDSVQRMAELTAEQKLGALPVEKEMLRLNAITTFQIPPGHAPADILLSDLRRKYDGRVTRLPILDADNAVLYIVHQSMIFRFIADRALATPAIDISKLTLKDLIDDAETKSNVTNIAFGPISTTVAIAKTHMEQQKGCQDFVITQTGRSSEPMLGWITNVDIGRLSKA